MGVISYFKKKKYEQNFKFIYGKYYNAILRRISYLIQDMHAAEDLTQEVFMKLYNLPLDHSNIAAWLNKVSTNVSYNYMRDKKIHEGKNEMILKNLKLNSRIIRQTLILRI